jgi:hypothetical protein
MKRALAGSAIAVVLVGAMAGPAFAGEVGGNGKPTPIAQPPEGRFQAGSICAFSGQNDNPTEEGEFAAGRVQSFGDIVQEVARRSDGKEVSAGARDIQSTGPGTECRGFASAG